jgi:ribosomal protein L34
MPTLWIGAFRLLRLICIRERISLLHCHQAFSTLGGEALVQARTMGYKVRAKSNSGAVVFDVCLCCVCCWGGGEVASQCRRRAFSTLGGEVLVRMRTVGYKVSVQLLFLIQHEEFLLYAVLGANSLMPDA